MRPVFVDTSFWIALRDRREQRHERARRLAARLVQERRPLIVTTGIFAETHAYFVRSVPLREQIIGDFWANPVVRVERPTPEDEQDALTFLRLRRETPFSFVDAVSFSVMVRLGLDTAASFDLHFRRGGDWQVLDG